MTHPLSLEAQIESVLFFKAEPLSISKLAKIFNVTEDDIEKALTKLQENINGRGIVVVRKDNDVMLQTAPDMSSMIETLTKEELSKDIGRAGLEVMALVLYRGPIAKSDIDYIRGVNSSFILRNLMIRGLVEREVGARNSFVYKPTFALLSHLGVKTIEELPDFKSFQSELDGLPTEHTQHEQSK